MKNKKKQLTGSVLVGVMSSWRIRYLIGLELANLLPNELAPSESTVRRYIKANHPILTKDPILRVISSELHIAIENLIEEVPMGDTTTVL